MTNVTSPRRSTSRQGDHIRIFGNHVEPDSRMNLAAALKGAVADTRPLKNVDFRRRWITHIITMIGVQLTAARLESRADMRPGSPPGVV
jgi:hypothetical protein